MLLWLWQVEQACAEQSIQMSTANHDLAKEHGQLPSAIRIIWRAEILLENLESAGVRLLQELEVGIEF